MHDVVSGEHPAMDWDALSTKSVPAEVIRILENAGFEPASSCFCVHSHLSPDGDFKGAWMAGSTTQLMVISGEYLPIWKGKVAEVLHAETHSVTGGGSLALTLQEGRREIMRFDTRQAALFTGIAHCLERHARLVGKVPPETDHSEKEEASIASIRSHYFRLLEKQRALYCPICGRFLIKHSKVCRFCVPKASTLKRILGFSLPYWRQLATMAVLMVGGTMINLIPPQITRILIDDVLLSPEHANRLPWLVGLLALIMILGSAIAIVRSRLGIWVGCHVTNDIQARAFNHLQALSLSFFNRQQTGALMSRVNNDARQMQGFLVEGIQYTVVNLLTVVGVAAVLIWMNPFLGILVLLPTPLVVLLSAYIWRRIGRRFRLLWVATASVTTYLNDALSGIRVIKAFGREEAEKARFGRRLGNARHRMIDAEQTWQTLVPVLNLIVQSSLVLVWYFGAFQVYGGNLTVGGLVAYIGYLGMIYGPLQLLTRLNDWLTRSLTAAARVFEVLDTEKEVEDKSGATSLPEVKGNLKLQNVTFGYEKHQPVIKQINLEIQAGEMVGLVGKSGAGKSTLINLIGRFYDVNEGTIFLDGIDIRDICLKDLRRHIGYVLQDTFLFSGTVTENIAYARPEVEKEEVIQAAISANAHEFIMNLPDAYDTLVGERGSRLSGGERQRIAIARALLQNPAILILDEATSSVDTETEARIQEALGRLIKGRTTLAIAHRLSTLRHASKLVVLKDGQVAEEGSHRDLMKKENGIYRKLVTIQTEWSRVIGIGS